MVPEKLRFWCRRLGIVCAKTIIYRVCEVYLFKGGRCGCLTQGRVSCEKVFGGFREKKKKAKK